MADEMTITARLVCAPARGDVRQFAMTVFAPFRRDAAAVLTVGTSEAGEQFVEMVLTRAVGPAERLEDKLSWATHQLRLAAASEGAYYARLPVAADAPERGLRLLVTVAVNGRVVEPERTPVAAVVPAVPPSSGRFARTGPCAQPQQVSKR